MEDSGQFDNEQWRTEILALRSDLAAMAFLFALRQRDEERKHNPNWAAQPRAPRGASDGGQWVDGGGGGGKAPKQAAPRRTPESDEPVNDNARVGRIAAPRPNNGIDLTSLPLRGLGGVVSLAAPLSGDTPQPIVNARLVPGAHDLLLVHVRDPRTGQERAHFERIVVPERQAPLVVFEVDTGLTMTVPPVTERLDVPVEIIDGEARFDPRLLARTYGADIPGITVAAAEIGIVIYNPDEADLVGVMRAQGATSAQIRNAVENLRRNRTVLPDSDRRANFPLTRPTGRRGGGNLTGPPSRPSESDKDSKRTSLRRENDVAEILNRQAYRVHQNPNLTSDEKGSAGLDADVRPDLIVGGRVFDVISPVTPHVRNIRDRIASKVGHRQAFRMVVNLEGTTVTRAQLQRYLRVHPVNGLREVITIDRQRRIAHAYP